MRRTGDASLAANALRDLWRGLPTKFSGPLNFAGSGPDTQAVTKIQPGNNWRSKVSLHPKNAVVSVAYGTDGFTQVGYSGFDVRVRAEANKGNKDKRFNYAYVWNGSAASAVNIHAGGFTHTYATAIKGQWIAGYGADETRLGTPAYYHAIVWDAAYQVTDLNAALAALPATYVGSQALAVDELGNVAGYALTATGYRQAVVWVRNP